MAAPAKGVEAAVEGGTIHLTVNGEPHEHRGDGTLNALLAELGADPARVAVLVDGEVVTRDRRAACRLAEDSAVDVLTFAGGG